MNVETNTFGSANALQEPLISRVKAVIHVVLPKTWNFIMSNLTQKLVTTSGIGAKRNAKKNWPNVFLFAGNVIPQLPPSKIAENQHMERLPPMTTTNVDVLIVAPPIQQEHAPIARSLKPDPFPTEPVQGMNTTIVGAIYAKKSIVSVAKGSEPAPGNLPRTGPLYLAQASKALTSHAWTNVRA